MFPLSHLRSHRLLTFPICLSDIQCNQTLNRCFSWGFLIRQIFTLQTSILLCTCCVAVIHSVQSQTCQTSQTGCPSLVGRWHLHQQWLQIVYEARLQSPTIFFKDVIATDRSHIFSVLRSHAVTSRIIYTRGKKGCEPPQEKLIVTHHTGVVGHRYMWCKVIKQCMEICNIHLH